MIWNLICDIQYFQCHHSLQSHRSCHVRCLIFQSSPNKIFLMTKMCNVIASSLFPFLMLKHFNPLFFFYIYLSSALLNVTSHKKVLRISRNPLPNIAVSSFGSRTIQFSTKLDPVNLTGVHRLRWHDMHTQAFRSIFQLDELCLVPLCRTNPWHWSSDNTHIHK